MGPQKVADRDSSQEFTVSQGNIVETYAAQGYLTRVPVFSRGEIDAFRRSFDDLEAREGREQCRIGVLGRHLKEEFIWLREWKSPVEFQ